MSSSERKLLTIVFDGVDKHDLEAFEELRSNGFQVIYVGVDGGQGTSYECFARPDRGAERQDADISLDDALAMGKFDVLLIPGYLTATHRTPEQVHKLGQLVEKAEWVVGLSIGTHYLAASGALDGMNACISPAFASSNDEFGPRVHWDMSSDLVRDGKFITATLALYNKMEQVLHALLDAMNIPYSRSGTPTPVNLDIGWADPSLTTLTPWQTRLRKLRAEAQRRVETNKGVHIDPETYERFPFARTPASEDQISEAEARLDISLPEDYKEFLLTADGLGFSGTSAIPSLKSVRDLAWENAVDLGLDLLRLNVRGSEEGESESATPLERVLQISDPDDDTVLCYVEPAFASRATGEPKEWVLFQFVPGGASYKEYESFTDWVESKLPQATS